jgi:hypothetical protein
MDRVSVPLHSLDEFRSRVYASGTQLYRQGRFREAVQQMSQLRGKMLFWDIDKGFGHFVMPSSAVQCRLSRTRETAGRALVVLPALIGVT